MILISAYENIKDDISQFIEDVQAELDKSKDNTISRTFTFDRKTDIGLIQVGDRYHACVSGDDLRPPEGTEWEKRVIKHFYKPNSLPARKVISF